MAYTAPTYADFRSRFDRDFAFSSPNTPDDMTRVREKDIAVAYKQASANFNVGLFADQDTYSEAFLLLAAHCLVGNMTAAAQGVGSSAQWLTASKGIGNVSESFRVPDRIARSPWLSALSKTQYGFAYLQIIMPLLSGNVTLVRGDTTP